MYSFDSRVRYSEVGEDKRLSLNGIINYFQDCSTFQSEELNVGLEKLEGMHRVWVLSSWAGVRDREISVPVRRDSCIDLALSFSGLLRIP